MRRSLTLVVVAVIASLFPAVGAQAAQFDPGDMTFPLGGNSYRITDSFGACRGSGCSRSHEGVDIMAPKGTPVYAVADGVAHWVSASQAECCRLQIDHGNGWATRYIHLNDDTKDELGNYATDDLGWGIVEGITDGTPVTRGQLIGWVGDSGNATEGVPHLHFELRQYDGYIWDSVAIDAYPYLLAAEHNYAGQFLDDDRSVHQENIDKIYAERITVGCNPPLSNLFCPERTITRGEMAAFLSRALGLTEGSNTASFADVSGHLFEKDVNRIAAAGIGFACQGNDYCPDRPILREEMAEMLVRAFGYENPDAVDFFVDDEGSQFEESINKLARHRVTLGCNPPENDNFCPDRTLSRAEMASFFVRALGL